MVALLWDTGHVLAAIELETLWNDLARELPFSLFCSYPAPSVFESEHAEAVEEICRLHSSVLGRSSEGDQGVAAPRSPEHEVLAEFAAEHTAPGSARGLVAAAMRCWGSNETVLEDAALVLSELATNAVLHAGSPFSIAVRLEDSTLRIAVRDASPLTAARGMALIPQPGHGLGVIDALSTRWGVQGTPDGKVVWAELQARKPCD
jgi:anti-sigma regulatory factor (Ser/Thr protein kinase)